MYRREANNWLGSEISNKQKNYLHRLICAKCTKDKKVYTELFWTWLFLNRNFVWLNKN